MASTKKREKGVIISEAKFVTLTSGQQVITGRLDPQTAYLLQVGPYQREPIPAHVSNIKSALRKGDPLPHIWIGYRSLDIKKVNDDKDFLLQGAESSYVIDGLQRVTALRDYISDFIQDPSRSQSEMNSLDVTVFVNTTEASEKDLFRDINSTSRKVSGNVLFRNMAGTKDTDPEIPVVKLLYDLTTKGSNFALLGKISWKQNLAANEVMNAVTMAQVICYLHKHVTGKMQRVGNYKTVAESLRVIHNKVDDSVFWDNTRTFFNMMVRCFDIQSRKLGGMTNNRNPALANVFMASLAKVISDHSNFWDKDGRLVFTENHFKRFRSFDLSDKDFVAMLAGGGAKPQVEFHIIASMNHKLHEKNHLAPRKIAQKGSHLRVVS